MATWVNAAGPLTLDADDNSWANYTLRQHIAAAQISNTGLYYARLTLEAGSTEDLSIGACYIQQAADSGDAWDFSTTPVQALWAGAGTKIITAGTQAVSDTMVFSIPAAKPLVVSIYIANDGTKDMVRRKVTQTGYTNYYKAGGNDAATVDATGYSTAGANVQVLARIEVAALDSGFFYFF